MTGTRTGDPSSSVAPPCVAPVPRDARRALRFVLRAGDEGLGAKAAGLAALGRAGLPVPLWFVLSPAALDARGALRPEALVELEHAVRGLVAGDGLLAVRSSAPDEDGAALSFAGQLESFLFVRPDDVSRRAIDVWRSASAERVAAYRRGHGLSAAISLPAVLVQRMVDPDAAGVAFSADPVTGRRGICVVASTWGLGTSVVSGEHDADTFQVEREGRIVQRSIATKLVALRRGTGGATEERLEPRMASAPSLDDERVAEVARLARAAAAHFGRPQDVEWALAGGRVWLLQSRPITSLAALPDPDGALAVWDNSNIVESYGGVTTPLTYTFARRAYEEVYRQFCRMVGVPAWRVEESGDAFRAMIGFVRGRIYYNLVSWHRVLALLPGYALNRRFMEQMMGVREPLPADALATAGRAPTSGRLRDGLAAARGLAGLLRAWRRLSATSAAFRSRVDDALAPDPAVLAAMRPDELVRHYRDLEERLLRRWDAPLVNDFLAMILFGVLRALARRWCGDAHGTLQNELVAGEGAIVSAEPARRIREMARLAAAHRPLADVLCDGTVDEIRSALAAHEPLRAQVDSYLAAFGDRCLEELKLETATLADDPTLLYRCVGQLARSGRAGEADRATAAPRRAAEERVLAALRGRPLRRLVFRGVLRQTRARVRDRENLRFERTRVFGRVRRIVVELGRRYAALGLLDDPRDIFLLTIDEALAWDGTAACTDLRGLAAVRRAEQARWRTEAAPAERFETRGMVAHGHDFRATRTPPIEAMDDDVRHGTGCGPGTVRGLVRVVRDPRSASPRHGEILVAEQTDPGWVILFPAAGGLLVERGSLLSHTAIVARELGLPAVVGLAGATHWLRDGDEVELDGRTGEVRRLRAAERRHGD